ncbi:DUF2846 domain-containing protein [Bradyrhizobium sp. LTSPM299]|uniref:DUF2846 domain-containing protein n=1 Tax=Bradyrhizobium sp. LTSPM299 TaxID=1619233 RepID=UPI001FDA53EC|nr:DUF2846 domain-containing protein [Bradyrhizobium sp. LTSPM299]
MLLMSGCVSDGVGTDYAAISQKVGPPKPGQSRIVVLQEKRKGLSAFCGCDVKLDGEPIGKVAIGTYVFADRPAGRHQFIASETLFPGDTTYNFSTEPGRTYFFLVRASERYASVSGVTMMGGLVGGVIASAVTANAANPGPADFFALDEPTARTTLAELQLAQ